MESKGNLIRVLMAIFFLAAPALTLRILSNYYDEPYLQPLALTKESLAAGGEGNDGGRFARIDVRVGWGRDYDGTITQTRLHEMISGILERQTEFYNVEIEDLPGEQVDVSFYVGPNSYGPFPPGQMIAGIKSALIALRMTNGPEG